MIQLRLFLLMIWACLCSAIFIEHPLHYVEDECKTGNQTISYVLDPSHPQTSTAVVKATQYAPYSPNRNCTVVLDAPPGYGIVLSIRKIDFIEDYFACSDYLKVLLPTESKTFCRFVFDLQESRSFYTDGPMKLLYHSEGRPYGLYAEIGFEVTATAVEEGYSECLRHDHFRCSNTRCIWRDLICDGRNNCGDGSDESPQTCDSIPPIHDGIEDYIVYICVVALFIVCTGITISYMTYRRKARAASLVSEDHTSNSFRPPYQAMHPASNFCSQNPDGSQSLNTARTAMISRQDDSGFSNPCYSPGIPPPPYRP